MSDGEISSIDNVSGGNGAQHNRQHTTDLQLHMQHILMHLLNTLLTEHDNLNIAM